MPFSVFFAVRTGNTGILRPKERQNQAALSLFISVYGFRHTPELLN